MYKSEDVAFEHIKLSSRDNVAVVTLDRPPVNAISQQTYREIVAAFTVISNDVEQRVVVLTSSSDRIFSGGADIKVPAGVDVLADEERHMWARRTFDTVRHCKKPVIAALSGVALGSGAILAACADIRIAAEGASIGLPEVTVGRVGGYRHLANIVPQAYLRRMYFTGEPMTAEEAHRLGVVVSVVGGGRDAFDDAVFALAGSIAAKNGRAVQLGKESMLLAEKLDTEDGYALEQQFTHRLLAEEQ